MLDEDHDAGTEKKGRTRKRVTKHTEDWIKDEWKKSLTDADSDREAFSGRYTKGDRLPIYSLEQMMKRNKPESGKTKDCPFDCNCCFI